MERISSTLAGVLTTAAFITSATAQKADLTISPKSGDSVRYTIETKSQVERESQMLFNGEERNFGGRGGGAGAGGTTELHVKLVFDEAKAKDGTQRVYHTAEAVMKGTGRDGEPTENTIASGLAGKTVFLIEDDRGIVAFEGDADGEEMNANMTRGVPVAMDLAGLAPAKEIEIGTEFPMGSELQKALANFAHPVRAGGGARGAGRGGDAAGGEGGRRGRGRGEQGGEEGGAEGGRRGRGRGEQGGEEGGAEGGRRGRGRGEQGGQEGGQEGGRRGRGRGEQGEQGAGRGQRGQWRGRMGAEDAALALVGNDKLTTKATGKLVSVETKDGIELATIAIEGSLNGKGKPDELGLNPMARMMGRGRRGGFGGGEQDETEGSAAANVSLKGTLIVDTTNHRVHSLKLTGSVESTVEIFREFDRGGEVMDIEMNTDTEGTFEIHVSTANAPASKSADKK